MKRKILIIGRCPPPVGGVSNHVCRLKENLREANFESFALRDLNIHSKPSIICDILRTKIIHLHISNPFLQLVFALVCRLLLKKSIITYHGAWGRYKNAGNLAVGLSARFATIPIVQDKQSLAQAMKMNANSRQISTYLPSKVMQPLAPEVMNAVARLKEKRRIVFCTNAWKRVFDKYGKEIYGISEMARLFAENEDLALIISDPSGEYSRSLADEFGKIPSNILMLDQPHDFRSVLVTADVFIRNTTTDGVSLSIFEARNLQIPVITSDRVSRPGFCYQFRDISTIGLGQAFFEAKKRMEKDVNENGDVENPIEEIKELYNALLDEDSKKTKA